MTDESPVAPLRRRHGRRLAVAAFVAVLASTATLAMPASAVGWPWSRTTTTKAPTTTAAPTTTTTKAPTGPCGAQVLKADGTPWQCTFVDDFGGSSLDRSKWLVQTTAASGYGAGTECYVDAAANVSVSSGALRLTTRKETRKQTCGSVTSQYTSGSVNTFNRFTQAFGRFEFRARFPDVKTAGLHGAIWMWPEDVLRHGNEWPMSGEIDVAEVYSQYNDRAIPFIHYVSDPADLSVTNNYCTLRVQDWTTYLLEWTPSVLTISFNGVPCLTHRIDPAEPLMAPAPFDQPFMLALTQGHGQGANRFVAGTSPSSGTMQIDYVRVWM